MKAIILVSILLALFVSGSSLAQGHYEVTGEKTSTIKNRSSDYTAEGKEYEKSVPITLEYNTDACKADLNLEYFQKGTDAHVKSTLHNDDCGASSGNYTVRVQYKDAAGGSKQVEFEETWERNDDSDVTGEKDYYVGDDVDILRVRSKGLSCSCVVSETIEEQTGSGDSE